MIINLKAKEKIKMSPVIIALIATVVFLLIAVLLTSYICFYLVFFVSEKRKRIARAVEFPIPEQEEYKPYEDRMKNAIREAGKLPYRAFSLTSRDGLTLRARYYEYEKGAPIELMMHGYRGSAKRDMSAGIFRCFSVGRNAFVIDHRAAGESDGHIITFGIREKEDCLDWLNLIIKEFGEDCRVILTGISMGAATVMMAAGENLPENVVGVLADCGYTTAERMIKKVIREMRLPENLLFPFVRLGGLIFGGFDILYADVTKAIVKCKLPIIFYHGDADGFVPADMSRENYELCSSRKKLVITPNAAHGICYLEDPKGYVEDLRAFFGEGLSASKAPENAN